RPKPIFAVMPLRATESKRYAQTHRAVPEYTRSVLLRAQGHQTTPFLGLRAVVRHDRELGATRHKRLGRTLRDGIAVYLKANPAHDAPPHCNTCSSEKNTGSLSFFANSISRSAPGDVPRSRKSPSQRASHAKSRPIQYS